MFYIRHLCALLYRMLMLYGTAVWLVIATCWKIYSLKELEWLLGVLKVQVGIALLLLEKFSIAFT